MSDSHNASACLPPQHASLSQQGRGTLTDLDELIELEAQAAEEVRRAIAYHDRIRRALAKRLALTANKPPKRIPHLKRIVLIPLGIGVAIAAAIRAWIARNSQTLAVAGASAAVTVASTLGTVHVLSGGDGNDNHITAPRATPSPTIGHHPADTPAPKQQQQPDGPAPSSTPAPATTREHVPTMGAGPTSRLPAPPVAPPPLVPTLQGGNNRDDDAQGDERSCRIELPHGLHRGLLCGRLMD